VVKALEEDRQETEDRLREVETESQRLEMERDASSRKVSDLKASQHNAELYIIEAKIDMEILKTGASGKAKENMQLTSDLEGTRQHRDEMLHMIEWLKTAQKDLESNSKLSYEEIAKLAAQNEGKAIELILLQIENVEEMICLHQAQ
jgi:hypothetical protein